MYCLQACMCALFSPGILQAGAVKGLNTHCCRTYNILTVLGRKKKKMRTTKKEQSGSSCRIRISVLCRCAAVRLSVLRTALWRTSQRRNSLDARLYMHVSSSVCACSFLSLSLHCRIFIDIVATCRLSAGFAESPQDSGGGFWQHTHSFRRPNVHS